MNFKPREAFRRWGAAVLIMGLIFLASAVPSRQMPHFWSWDTLVKKGGHMTGYALLAAAYLYGLSAGRRPRWRWLALAVGLAGLYALTDEYHQTWVPGRNASLVDVAIDTTGAIIGSAGATGWWRRRRPAAAGDG